MSFVELYFKTFHIKTDREEEEAMHEKVGNEVLKPHLYASD